MQNLGNVYICGSPFVMGRTDIVTSLIVILRLVTNKVKVVHKPYCVKSVNIKNM
jgi:hypothetical protein